MFPSHSNACHADYYTPHSVHIPHIFWCISLSLVHETVSEALSSFLNAIPFLNPLLNMCSFLFTNNVHNSCFCLDSLTCLAQHFIEFTISRYWRARFIYLLVIFAFKDMLLKLERIFFFIEQSILLATGLNYDHECYGTLPNKTFLSQSWVRS